MQQKSRVQYLFLIALVLFLILGYKQAFDQANCLDMLESFDNIMSQDIAQIARNTLRGQFLTTKYILPVSYAYFPYIDDHPDFIRYPFIVMLYAVLFTFAPLSSATVKTFNSALFVLNGIFVFMIALDFLNRNGTARLPRVWKNAIAMLTALFTSFMLEDYLRYSLTDAYEIPTITVLLLLIMAVFIKRSAGWTGLAQGVLYLCRPNMVVYLPFLWVYLMMQKETAKVRLGTTLMMGGAFGLVIAPFLIRNLFLSGRLLFSLQQSLELFSGTTASHNELYRTFSTPPSVFPLSSSFLSALWRKFNLEVVKPIFYAMNLQYVLGWLGVVVFFIRFKKDRMLLVLLLLATVLHVFLFSIYLQIDRVYIPIFFLLTIFGYLGLFTFLAFLWQKYIEEYFSPDQSILLLGILTFSRFALLNMDIPQTDRINRNQPPSLEAVEILIENDISCVFSNNPFWIPWHVDIIAIYEPVIPEEILDNAPDSCNYYIADERLPFPREFLDENAELICDGENYRLYRLE